MCQPQPFFCWQNIARWQKKFKNAKFGPKTHFLIAKTSSILTNFHPFEQIFINL
jgi:hypothetical protein